MILIFIKIIAHLKIMMMKFTILVYIMIKTILLLIAIILINTAKL